MTTSLVGRKARLQFHTATCQTVSFSATVIKENADGTVTLRIPSSVRSMKWCPWTESAYRFRRAAIERALEAAA